MSHRRPIIPQHRWLKTAFAAVLMCDTCDLPADYELIARWPDDAVRKREACLRHMETGVVWLYDLRPEAGEPKLSRLALTVPLANVHHRPQPNHSAARAP
jgi:hypothetical protein